LQGATRQRVRYDGQQHQSSGWHVRLLASGGRIKLPTRTHLGAKVHWLVGVISTVVSAMPASRCL
jgi:hypothetical protein